MIDLCHKTIYDQIQNCSFSSAFREIVHHTPIQISTVLSKSLTFGDEQHIVAFKCEHLQQTGSFKLRGTTHFLLQHLMESSEGCEDNKQQFGKKFYTASSGNHGFATAYAALKLGNKVSIYVPSNADKCKIRNIENLVKQSKGRLSLCISGPNCLDAEKQAREDAQIHGGIYISPYNDPLVVAGQGTIGIEIIEQMDLIYGKEQALDAIFISVGGGGLISGITIALKEGLKLQGREIPKIFGVQPLNSNVMMQSVQNGTILQDVEEFPTFSDGTAGGIEDDSITFELCKNEVDEWISCTEDEILNAWDHLLKEERMLVEGSAALALAGYLKVSKTKALKNVLIVLCGRNISHESIQVSRS